MSAATVSLGYPPAFYLSWGKAGEEDRRFRRILLIVLGLLLLLGVLMPYLPVAQLPKPEVDEQTSRPVRILPPAPPQPVAKPTPAPPIEAQPAEQAEIRQQPSPTPAPAPAPSDAPQQPSTSSDPRQQAQRSGILAMRDRLGSMRENPSAGRINDGPLSSGDTRAQTVERSVLTSEVGSGSSGIDTGRLSRGFGGGDGSGGSGGGLGRRDTTQVDSPIGMAAAASGGGSGRANKMASRTDEEIQLVFDRNKAAIFGIYNRALRHNAALQGKVVLRLTITPAGDVSDIRIVSSELGDQDLENRLLLRIKQFNFGAKDVETVTVNYPIEFFPSA